MKIYRIIEYDGDEKWINNMLDSSIHGTRIFTNENKITVGTISQLDNESIDLARNYLQEIQGVIKKVNKEEIGFGE